MKGMQRKGLLCAAVGLWAVLAAHGLAFLEPTPRADELGRRPADGAVASVNPVPFVWQPQAHARMYEVAWSQQADFAAASSRAGLVASAFCDARTWTPGTWYWRVRFTDVNGVVSDWSSVRRFTVPESAVALPQPPLDELLARIPSGHPRLFLRPEDLPAYRDACTGRAAAPYAKLKEFTRKFLRDYTPPVEPPLYPAGMSAKTKGEAWKKIWWGNRVYVLKYLGGAAQLAFKWRLDGDEKAADVAKEILLAAAAWDPKGSTGYRYNDEAGMPFNARFARTYSLLADRLTAAERERCRAVMRIRGEEMYRYLCPRLYQKPYDSHANRAWHFLGEVAIAFYGEIPEARAWLAFALDYSWCIYPVWGDADGGWHEGAAYWESYMNRFFWWGDIMWSMFRVNVYEKPYFAHAGDFPLYQEVPGFEGGGFADCAEQCKNTKFASVMLTLAAGAGDPAWQWYAERAMEGRKDAGEDSYVAFARLARAQPVARAPVEVPQSKLFRGTGLALMNTCLTNAADDVQVLFKSSPDFGTASHGYDANNSFLMNAWGDRLFIHGGLRDCYGSPFHKDYMWATKSCNAAGPTGDTQRRRTIDSRGRILSFHTSPKLDVVVGEVGDMWEKHGAERHMRELLFCKQPEPCVLVIDRFTAKSPTTFTWYLHTPDHPFDTTGGQHGVRTETAHAEAAVNFLYPDNLELATTSAFDPPIGYGRKLVQHHLTATTREPATSQLFVTFLSPHKRGTDGTGPSARLVEKDGKRRVRVTFANGEKWESDI